MSGPVTNEAGEIQTGTLFESEARTASANSDPVQNRRYRGVLVTIDCTAITSTPSVVFTIQGQDHAGNWYDILASAAITSTGQDQLQVFPGAAATAEVSASHIIPRVWRLEAVHADGDSITYSAGYEMLP